MYNINELPASKLLAMEGAKLEMLRGRAVVCKLKKELIIADSVLEKGEKVVCSYDFAGDGWKKIYISEAEWLKHKTTAELFSKGMVAINWAHYSHVITLQEFRDCFEILDEESEIVTKHIQASEEEICRLQEINGERNSIKEEAEEYMGSAITFQVVYSCMFFFAAFIMAALRSDLVSGIIATLLTCTSIIGIINSLSDNPFLLSLSRKYKKAKKEYEDLCKRYDDKKEKAAEYLDNIRRKDGWLIKNGKEDIK